MANDEVKKENDAEEKKTESDKAEKEFDAAKWRLITIASTIGLVIAAIAFFVITYFCDDSGRSLIEYIEQGLVVFVALISGCVSIISMINGKENDIEQQKREKQLINEQREREDRLRKEQGEREDILIKQQKEFEEKWNQKKIDADLKAHARIEWIQKVRNATAEFITACYCILRLGEEYNQDKVNEVFPDIQKTGLLLILFFGPDQSGENEEITDIINDILISIEKIILEGYKEKICKTIVDDNQKIDMFHDDLINNHGISEDELNFDLGFEESESSEKKEIIDSYHKFLSSCSNRAIKLQNEYYEFITKLNDDLHDLSGVIREYLKREWDRAKNNED
ncbi:MAG: hypothetical protein IJK31_02810 [Ruminococcus sp.]|nr:hypothetical protein [Ruminococcus sp.]